MTPVMRPALSLTQVYLYRQPIDFRKSHRGLSAIIECVRISLIPIGHFGLNRSLYFVSFFSPLFYTE